MQSTTTFETPAAETTCPPDTVGGHLCRLRHERRLAIAEIAELTRISTTTIQAIEQSEFDKLPADPFARGLLAKYAKFLGAEPEALAEDFFRERDSMLPGRKKGGGRRPNMPLQPVRLAEPVHVSSALVAGLLLLGLILSFSAFCLYTSWNPIGFLLKKNETSSVPFMPIPGIVPAQATNPAPGGTTAGGGEEKKKEDRTLAPAMAPDTAQAQALTAATYRLELEPLRTGQLEVSIDGGLWKKHEFLPGDKLEYRAEKTLQLRFDQPNIARLQLNGAPVAFPPATDGRYSLTIPEDLLR
ncbi:MAG: hypothetical protein BWK76_01735 [Desulfobulbaceae bacterium A2]|nr:MAG: hypothetical protein BWK76_01735 [Desulfobulbaceae bacterium A2]